MKKLLLVLTLILITQNIALCRDVTIKDRISHPVATIIHSFAWLSDPFYLISCFGIGYSSRTEDDYRYKKYVTGETEEY